MRARVRRKRSVAVSARGEVYSSEKIDDGMRYLMATAGHLCWMGNAWIICGFGEKLQHSPNATPLVSRALFVCEDTKTTDFVLDYIAA